MESWIHVQANDLNGRVNTMDHSELHTQANDPNERIYTVDLSDRRTQVNDPNYPIGEISWITARFMHKPLIKVIV